MKTEVETKELRKFGLTLCVIFFLIGGILAWKGRMLAPYFLGAGGVALVLSLVLPAWLTPVYRFMLWLAGKLAWVNTRILLIFAYYVIFTPIGLILRLVRVDLLDQKWDRQATSYWAKVDDTLADQESCQRQF